MEAGRLTCPSCGAPARTDADHCEQCGTRLATVACPSCFGMMFRGSRFCPHCGARWAREKDGDGIGRCPRCQATGELRATKVGPTPLSVCGRCAGIWIEAAVFQGVCDDRASRTPPVVFNPAAMNEAPTLDVKLYLKCPRCEGLMNRVNFARRSGVVVDICRSHGIWLDREEFRAIITFIRAGGLDRARQLEDEAARQQRSLDRISDHPKRDPSGVDFSDGSGGGSVLFQTGDPQSMVDVVDLLGEMLHLFGR